MISSVWLRLAQWLLAYLARSTRLRLRLWDDKIDVFARILRNNHILRLRRTFALIFRIVAGGQLIETDDAGAENGGEVPRRKGYASRLSVRDSMRSFILLFLPPPGEYLST